MPYLVNFETRNKLTNVNTPPAAQRAIPIPFSTFNIAKPTHNKTTAIPRKKQIAVSLKFDVALCERCSELFAILYPPIMSSIILL